MQKQNVAEFFVCGLNTGEYPCVYMFSGPRFSGHSETVNFYSYTRECKRSDHLLSRVTGGKDNS